MSGANCTYPGCNVSKYNLHEDTTRGEIPIAILLYQLLKTIQRTSYCSLPGKREEVEDGGWEIITLLGNCSVLQFRLRCLSKLLLWQNE